MFTTDDTIVAVSTPAGAGARAIVRLSGEDAVRLAGRVFASDGADLRDCGGFRCVGGRVRLGAGGSELPARAYVFRAPRSYTREDVIELHLPGAPPAVAAVMEALLAAGARAAGPGEFTARAFFAGRIDLSEAEAVADVIDAADDARLRSAVATLGGRVSGLCGQASADLAEALAEVEASIDLADEPLDIAPPGALADRLDDVAARLDHTAREAADAPDATDRPHVVLAGRPNVGKSCLLNALTGTERAIVNALAGTTRDVLSAPLDLNGTAVVLQDAAGFAHSDDPLEAAAHAAARSAVRGADAVLFVVDATCGWTGDDGELLDDVRAANRRAPLRTLVNKVDACAGPSAFADLPDEPADALYVSAVTGQGLSDLRDRLAELLAISAERSGDVVALPRRQRRCLLGASAAVAGAADVLRDAAETSDAAELAAIELRAALAEIGRITGEVATEDLLGRIFARFCVGK